MKKVIILAIVSVFITGCENAGQKKTISEIATLTKQNKALTSRLEQAKGRAEQLNKQVQTLSVLKDKLRPEDIYDLQKIKIWRYTNLYDRNKDGKKETLLVYIQPLDEDGDTIKAAGAVEVQLWDLSREQQKAMVAQWQLKADELKKLWFYSLMGANYRLTFDVSDKIEKFEKPLTVKITFTDYLTGKVFTEQRVIKP